MLRVLSVDGGGVRGLVAALVLAELERRAGRPAADLFDVVAGVSTGSILALGLVCPDAHGRPRWSAEQLAGLYEDSGRQIFTRTLGRRVRTVDGFLAPKYDAAPLARVLNAHLGDTPLSAALREVLVPAYDLRTRSPWSFSTADVAAGTAPDQPMWRVALASSAAPTYFAPVAVPQADGVHWLVDGGLVASNPAALVHAQAASRDADVALVSVGTGSLSTDYATPRMLRAGALLWARPLFESMLDAQQDVTDVQLARLLPAGRYWRLQARLGERSARIDDGSDGNVRALRDATARLLEESSAALDAAVACCTPAAAAT